MSAHCGCRAAPSRGIAPRRVSIFCPARGPKAMRWTEPGHEQSSGLFYPKPICQHQAGVVMHRPRALRACAGAGGACAEGAAALARGRPEPISDARLTWEVTGGSRPSAGAGDGRLLACDLVVVAPQAAHAPRRWRPPSRPGQRRGPSMQVEARAVDAVKQVKADGGLTRSHL